MLDKLISEREKNKLDLFRYFEKYFGTSIKIMEIENIFGFTNYLIKQLVDELNEDTKKSPMASGFDIKIHKDEITFFQESYISSNILEELYLSESEEFKLLKSIFFGEFKTKKAYSDEHFLSRTTVYRLFDRVQQQLEYFGFELDSKGNLSGNEVNIRFFFSSLFYKVYKNDLSIYTFSSLTNLFQLETRISEVLDGFKTNNLFQHYILVSNIRFKKAENSLTNSDQFPIKITNKKLKKSVSDWLSRLGVKEKNKDFEMIALITSIRNIDYSNAGILRNFSLCDIFVDNFLEELNLITKEGVDVDEFSRRRLYDVFFNYWYINPFSDIVTRDIDLTYFKENFPEYFYACLNFTKKRIDNNSNKFNKVSLFFDLMLTVISILPYRSLGEEINVFINFTHGTSYNAFIKENIEMFSFYNFNFQDSLNPKTDLILSDYMINTETIDKTIVWLTPPRAKDWERFGEKIIEIISKKFRSKK